MSNFRDHAIIESDRYGIKMAIILTYYWRQSANGVLSLVKPGRPTVCEARVSHKETIDNSRFFCQYGEANVEFKLRNICLQKPTSGVMC